MGQCNPHRSAGDTNKHRPRQYDAALYQGQHDRGKRSISSGGPQKGINKANKDFFQNFSLNFRALKLMFLTFSEGPGRFRELREAGRNHFHLSWYLLVPGVTSYECSYFFLGTFFVFFKLGLGSILACWDLKNRIPRRKLRI